MNKKTIIFDFDGTLVDVEPLFIEIYNRLAKELHYTPIAESEIPELKKMGAKEFIKKRTRLPFWRLPRALKRGREEYRNSIERVELFEGMRDVVAELKTRRYRVGILSSNTKETIEILLKRFGMEVDFIYQGSLFGKARALKRTLHEEKIALSDALYFGDEVRDVEACHKCGLDVIAVTWGLNSKDALQAAGAATIDRPEEILEKLPAL